MNEKERALNAQRIIDNPLWETMKRELPHHYYQEFRATDDVETRKRIALAHDIFDDTVRHIERQAAMAEHLEFPDDHTERGDTNDDRT